MNCKPGDLAVIVRFNPAHPHLTGRIVEVIEAAPAGVRFRLPDGRLHNPCSPQGWIVLFQNPVDMTAMRGRADGLYAVCPDFALRPLRDPGEDAVDETLLILPAPRAPAPVTPAPREAVPA